MVYSLGYCDVGKYLSRSRLARGRHSLVPAGFYLYIIFESQQVCVCASAYDFARSSALTLRISRESRYYGSFILYIYKRMLIQGLTFLTLFQSALG